MKNFILAFIMMFGATSLFAQRSSYFNGTYVMDYGNQRMEIITEGGKYYHVKFTGDCNAKTRTGQVDNDVLMIPMGSGNRDFIMISWQGDKLRVDVKGTNHMRNVCGGSSIQGLYSLKRNTNSGNYNRYGRYHEIQHEREYDSHVNVNDLQGWDAIKAYDELTSRGFHEVKKHSSNGKTYRVWYNNDTHQCIKTLSERKRISKIMKSTHCW